MTAMTKVANLADMMLRAELRHVAFDTPIGNIWCGQHLDHVLDTVVEHARVRTWTVIKDDHQTWHCYITQRHGMTHHGRAPSMDTAIRAAVGELLRAVCPE